MKVCQFCGEEVLESAKFCNHCGKDISNDQEVSSSEEPEQEISISEESENEITEEKQPTVSVKKVVKEKKSSNKKTKAILFSSIAIIILLIGGYIFGSYQTSASQVLKDFESAMKDKDTKKLADMLTVDDKEVKLTAKSLEGLVELYDSKPSELTQLLNNLKMQAEHGSNLTKMFPIDLIKDGKKYLFFDDHALIVNTVHISVATNYKDTDIIINGDVIAKTDSDDFMEEVGPLIPGEHVVEAVYDTGIFHLKAEKKVKAVDPGFAQYADLYLEGKDITFDLLANKYNDLKSIKLFINGKDTDWNLAKEDRVGPLLTDGTMNASFEAELPWGTIRTNDVPLNDSYFDFNLGNSDDFQQVIMDRIILFNEEYVDVFAKADPERMTTVTEDFMLLIADDIITSVIADVEYTGAYHGTDFYTDSFILKQDYDGLWKVTVDTITYTEEAFFEQGEKAKAEKIEEELQYQLAYDPQAKEWFVADMDHSGLMEEDKMERSKVSDPVVHTSDWKSLRKEIEKELGDLE